MSLKLFSLLMTVSLLSATTGFAGGLPEGSFNGNSSLIQGEQNILNNDIMALLIKKDPNSEQRYAILAEYSRLPLTYGKTLAITNWVPRLYIYKVDAASALEYNLVPLKVVIDSKDSIRNGAIEADTSVRPDALVLKHSGTLKGATLIRYNRTLSIQPTTLETITFKGNKVGSTWEDYVTGTFFGTNEKTGKDYFKKDVNTVLFENRVVQFMQKDIQGEYDLVEKLPGIYSFVARKTDNKGDDRVLSRIAVFVDIVNWKKFGFTTEELLMINPDNASDVGFYYERH